jgi:hypothetical protein
MRTTLRIDDDVLRVARSLAEERRESIGKVLSDLARKGLRPSAEYRYRKDFPVFDVRQDAPVFGPEAVEEALEEP